MSKCCAPISKPSYPAEAISVNASAVIFEDTLSRGSFTQAEYDAIAANFDANDHRPASPP